MARDTLGRSRLRGTAVLVTAIALGSMAVALGGSRAPPGTAGSIEPSTMPRVATVDERYQSYNVEMAELIGGNFWKPYNRQDLLVAQTNPAARASSGGAAPQPAGLDPSMFQARPPIDLANARLRRLAAAPGPANMRTSGTWANMIYFHDADTPLPSAAPQGFQGVLTRPEWKGVLDFARAVNAKPVSSVAISAGVRDAGRWTPPQARKLVADTKAAGGEVSAAEFFNEPTMPAYGGAPVGYTAADFAAFRAFVKEAVPETRVVGPGSVGEGALMPSVQETGMAAGLARTEDMLSASLRPHFDIFSYHFYGAVSQRCASMGEGAQTTANAALSEEWLSRTDRSYAFYRGLRDRFEPGAPIWVTETADAACGGSPWAATFLDTFRSLDQLGRLARRGVNVVFHNMLASSEYGLLDQGTFVPRPNYWAALLWHRLMGATVLDAGPSEPGLHLHAQCLPDRPGGVTLLAINTSRTEEHSLELPMAAERYTLTAQTVDAADVWLNGRELRLQTDDALPGLQGTRISAGHVRLAPTTMTFLAVPGAGDGSCR